MATTKVKVDGIAYYASVKTPNRHTGVYGVDLCVDEDTSKHLQSLGLSPARKQDGSAVRHGDNGMDVFRFKKKPMDRNGKELPKPQLVDSSGNAIDLLVGNGSKVRVYGNAYEYSIPGKKGVAASLSALQVIELQEVNFFDKIEGGFQADATVTNTVTKEDDSDIDTDII